MARKEPESPESPVPAVVASVTVDVPVPFRLNSGPVYPAGRYDLKPEEASPLIREFGAQLVSKNKVQE